jgi:peroxiredoxin
MGAIAVLDPAGRPVKLGELWADRPTIAVWLRHFGCQYCLQQVATLTCASADFEAAGAQLLLIGNGKPEQARRFQELRAPMAIVVTDPERRSYRALGARRSPLGVLGRGTIRGWLAARRLGIKADGLQGDILQLGGTLVVDPPNTVLLAHISSGPGDHPSVESLLAALRRSRVAAHRDAVA